MDGVAVIGGCVRSECMLPRHELCCSRAAGDGVWRVRVKEQPRACERL